MKFIAVALFAVIGLSAALPAVDPKDAEATIVDGSEKVAEYFNPEGYDYKFKTSNTIEKQEKSELNKGLVTGEYSYVNPDDNQTVHVTYTAGAGIGFFPRSSDIPQAIIDSIELNLKNPPEEKDTK